MWAEPQLEPVYAAVRSYLEMDQRVGLMMERLDVLGDLLAVLKDQVRTSHGETLEWIGGFFFPFASSFQGPSLDILGRGTEISQNSWFWRVLEGYRSDTLLTHVFFLLQSSS